MRGSRIYRISWKDAVFGFFDAEIEVSELDLGKLIAKVLDRPEIKQVRVSK